MALFRARNHAASFLAERAECLQAQTTTPRTAGAICTVYAARQPRPPPWSPVGCPHLGHRGDWRFGTFGTDQNIPHVSESRKANKRANRRRLSLRLRSAREPMTPMSRKRTPMSRNARRILICFKTLKREGPKAGVFTTLARICTDPPSTHPRPASQFQNLSRLTFLSPLFRPAPPARLTGDTGNLPAPFLR